MQIRKGIGLIVSLLVIIAILGGNSITGETIPKDKDELTNTDHTWTTGLNNKITHSVGGIQVTTTTLDTGATAHSQDYDMDLSSMKYMHLDYRVWDIENVYGNHVELNIGLQDTNNWEFRWNKVYPNWESIDSELNIPISEFTYDKDEDGYPIPNISHIKKITIRTIYINDINTQSNAKMWFSKLYFAGSLGDIDTDDPIIYWNEDDWTIGSSQGGDISIWLIIVGTIVLIAITITLYHYATKATGGRRKYKKKE